jgi:hypothetical protein
VKPVWTKRALLETVGDEEADELLRCEEVAKMIGRSLKRQGRSRRKHLSGTRLAKSESGE